MTEPSISYIVSNSIIIYAIQSLENGMLREPIGKHRVSIVRTDTEEIGDPSRRRKIPLTVFVPSKEWTEEYPYRDALYQKSMPDPAENGVHTFCGIDGELIDIAGTLPVIIYSHGLTGFEMESTVLCADLASSGYVVVAAGHPFGSSIVTYADGSTFVDDTSFDEMKKDLGSLEVLWYEDLCAVKSKLNMMNDSDPMWQGKLNLNSVGILGVSFGGCCGIAAALKDADIKYAVNLDGSLFIDLEYKYKDKPILVLCSRVNIMAYRKLLSNDCTNVKIEKIRKVTHWEFSDGVYLSDKGKSDREWADRVSKHRAERIIEFIDRVLKGCK